MGKKKNRIEKGSFQYIKRRRFRQGMFSLLGFIIVFAIYFIGYLLNNKSNANIFTVIAILSVLPTVKVLISFIVLVPFHSVGSEQYEEISNAVPKGLCWYTDYVFSSSEKVMMLDFIVISNGKVIAYASSTNMVDTIKKYILNGIRIRNIGYQVEIITKFDEFKKKVSKLNNQMNDNLDEYNEVKEFIHCLMV